MKYVTLGRGPGDTPVTGSIEGRVHLERNAGSRTGAWKLKEAVGLRVRSRAATVAPEMKNPDQLALAGACSR